MQRLKTYQNGLRVVHKKIDFVRSVTIGVWVGAGSVFETQNNSGISHFIEHMLFKGTTSRTAFQIADEVDCIGAQINAFTAKECTCYYTKSTDDHAEKCLEILSDMLYNSTFDEVESDKEKKVVLEEISMVEDSPEDVCHELLAKTFFGGSSLARPILGTPKSVRGLSTGMIRQYMDELYTPDNIVISIVGNIDFETADKLVTKYFDCTSVGGKHSAKPSNKTVFKSQTAFKQKQIEQANIAIAFPSIRFNDPKTYRLMLVNSVLGGGMSSRLFQRIREQKGLAYSVYSYVSAYKQNGMFSIFCGTNPSSASQALDAIVEEIQRLKKEGITDKEFLRGKEQLKGSFILAQENTASIMNAYGKQLLLTGELFDIDQKLQLIKDIKFEDCLQIIDQIFDLDKMCTAVVSSKEI